MLDLQNYGFRYETFGEVKIWEGIFTFSYVPAPSISFGRPDVSQQICLEGIGNLSLPGMNPGKMEKVAKMDK